MNIPSLERETTRLTGCSCRGIKAWDSISVYPAKVVLSVSNLISCFKSPFCFHSPKCLWIIGRWELNLVSRSFDQSYTSRPLKWDFPVPVNHYLIEEVVHIWRYMVLSSSDPLMISAWFTPQQGEFGLHQTWCLHSQDIFREPHLKIGHQYNQFTNRHQLGAPRGMAPDSFGNCLECCLENIEHVFTTLIKSLCFKGNTTSLAI